MNPSRLSTNSNLESNMMMQFPFNCEKIFEKDLEMKVVINSAEQSHPITFSMYIPRTGTFAKIRVLFTSRDDLYFLYSLEYIFTYLLE